MNGNLSQRNRISNMTDIDIKKVTLDNMDQLQKLCRQTFFETFSLVNTEENIQKYLDEAFSVSRLTEELNDNNVVFYFAIHEDQVIAYLKLNFGPSQTELQGDRAVEIERIYVLNTFQGKSVGQALFGKAIEIAREKGADYVWLGVWEENLKAINFYKKNGFIVFDKHLFKLGDDDQTDLMMKFELT